INILAERALNSVEQGLLQAPPASLGFKQSKKHDGGGDDDDDDSLSVAERHRHEVENGTHQLETLLCASIDRNFDKFELYVLRNILCVRPQDRDWIRLGHYEGLDLASPQRADAPTEQSVAALRRRLQASQQLNCMLHAERARNGALLGELRALAGGRPQRAVKREETASTAAAEGGSDDVHKDAAPLAFLGDRGDLTEGDAEKPLATTTAFTLSQLQALRALSTSLRNLRPDLMPSEQDPADADGKKGWRRERLEYVEGATKRHLENVRGLELGKNGEVRDGDWQGEGRQLGKGEVEGMEKVVSMLGGERQSSGEQMDES
ncbi:uncharacterized protein E0L32_011952, partial [Thyridium curvatum]